MGLVRRTPQRSGDLEKCASVCSLCLPSVTGGVACWKRGDGFYAPAVPPSREVPDRSGFDPVLNLKNGVPARFV